MSDSWRAGNDYQVVFVAAVAQDYIYAEVVSYAPDRLELPWNFGRTFSPCF